MKLPAENDLLLLFSKIAEGDEIAFAGVFKDYYDLIYSVALQYCKVSVVAEDVVQQVFGTLWDKRKSLKEVANPAGWLWSLSRNQAISALKKESGNRRYITYVKELFESESETPFHNLLQKEKRELLSSLIESLPRRQQQVYYMSRHEGLTYSQISEALGISLETVKEHMAKALKTLRVLLAKHKTDIFSFIFFLFLKNS
ncbi:MAG: RNA polymerase sigma factor [Niabella sp.]